MKKQDKISQVEEFQEKFSKADAAFIASYNGIDALDMTSLRGSLRESSVELKILRNTLAKRAVIGTPYESLSEHFVGPVAVALSYKDAALAAKTLTSFAKEQPLFELKVGALGEKTLELAEIKSLSELPSRDELLAKLVGVLSNVPGSFVRVLSGVPRNFVNVLSAIKKKKEE
ncbi:MAG: 50S ribosomal protein L10 [Deltaproteobacteria bacterium]|nr:50S ribosomal protein L10 [Deltaproteobacteria bacterium]